jgi:hypothetical protein
MDAGASFAAGASPETGALTDIAVGNAGDRPGATQPGKSTNTTTATAAAMENASRIQCPATTARVRTPIGAAGALPPAENFSRFALTMLPDAQRYWPPALVPGASCAVAVGFGD